MTSLVAVEVAYGLGDALEKRRGLMDAWAAFCGSGASGSVSNVHAVLTASQ